LVLAAVVLVAVVAFSFRPDYLGTLLSNPHLAGLSVMSWLLWFTAVGVILALLMHMKDVFTAPLELRVDAFDAQGNPISEDDLEAIRRVMRFGYSAMTLALVLSILLFMVPLFWTGSEHAFTQSPIGVLKGCRSYPDQIGSTSISEVDDPLSCEIHGPQWLLNIGGTVAPLYELLGQETRLTTEFQALVEDATALLKNLIDQLADGLEADGAGGAGSGRRWRRRSRPVALFASGGERTAGPRRCGDGPGSTGDLDGRGGEAGAAFRSGAAGAR
jgi:hypothetical protein